MHWPIPLNGHHPVSPCAHCPGERGGPARALRFNEKAVMPCRSGVLRDARGWIRERWLIAFAIPFEPNKRAGRVTGSTRRGGNLLNVRIVSRFFFAGSGGCAVLLAGWQETSPWGLVAWVQHGIRGPVGGFSAAFRASPLLFGPFLRLWSISRGPMVAFSASQGGKRCSEAP